MRMDKSKPDKAAEVRDSPPLSPQEEYGG